MRIGVIGVGLCSIVMLGSCVAERKYRDEVAKLSTCSEERAKLKSDNISLTAENNDLKAQLSDMGKRVETLRGDTTVLSNSLRRLTTNYDKLTETYDKLLAQSDRLKQESQADTRRLTEDLQSTRSELQKKADALRELETALARKEGSLDQLDKDLHKLKVELEKSKVELLERELRVMELERILSSKDSSVTALKDRIANALLGFRDQGLSVEMKNGKVYVSLEDRLLFASGSWTVDAKGRDALRSLAKVLETQPEVSILIEGHTDNVPYKGSGQVKDNWDLSVMRATSIVKLLTTEAAIQPAQLSAAGRSEYLPLEEGDSAEARRKNRRTDIIITPKLDELFKILNSH